MRKSEFQYDLPEELVAQQPVSPRSASRMLVVDISSGNLVDSRTSELPQLLQSGDLLVFNDTRVIPARLYGSKPTGGRVEVVVERVLDDHRVLALLGSSKTPRTGAVLRLENAVDVEILGRDADLFELRFLGNTPVLELLERYGHIPLPPYISRDHDLDVDRQRYQTIYASKPGAAAAPTAGLHFDEMLMAALGQRGVNTAFVTLHVGAGTFQPMRVDNILEHRMHSEVLEVSESVAAQIAATRQNGGRVIAVGTTVVRALETAAQASGVVEAFRGETAIFIYPGYKFRAVDAIVTNFHLPESTLLMLVCAFAGRETMMRAYRHAVDRRYRFFSYGDAMFIS